jgi:hypothetical protein
MIKNCYFFPSFPRTWAQQEPATPAPTIPTSKVSESTQVHLFSERAETNRNLAAIKFAETTSFGCKPYQHIL